MVVRGFSCCGACTYGRVFKVLSVRMSDYGGGGRCEACGATLKEEMIAERIPHHVFGLYRLKKINPPPIEQSTEREKELTI